MQMLGINFTVIHPQWGAPMGYHTLARVEIDKVLNETYVVFASYYSKEVAAAGGTQMSSVTIALNTSTLRNERDLLQVIIDEEGNQFSGATIDANDVAIEE